MLRLGDSGGISGCAKINLKRKACRLLLAAVFCSSAYGGGFSLQATGGYFQPRDQAFKDIYGSGLAYGAQADIGVWRGFYLWAGVSNISREGELSLTKEETKLNIIPFFGGLKFRFLKTSVRPYVALGVGYFRYQETNLLGRIDNGDIGFVGQVGVSLKTLRSFCLEVYARYSGCRIKPANIEANLGGLELGVGFGFEL
jgi:hypothetical protein